MALPSSVQAQVDNAERLQAIIAGEQDAAQAAANADAVASESPAAQNPQPAVAPQPDQAAQTAQPAQPLNPEDDPNSQTWQSRFRTLQGMFNAEVPKLQRDNAELARQMREMKEAFEATKAQPPAQPSAATGTSLVTQADVESFGQDLIDLMRKVAQEAIGGGSSDLVGTINALKADVESLKGNVGTMSERVVVNDRDRFLQSLEKVVPDWKAVDELPQWLEWLAQYDPLIGDTRQAALVQATNMMNTDRVAAFFNAFKATLGPAPPVPRNGNGNGAASREQQRQVAPPRSRSAAPVTSTDSKIWTGREIGQFYDEVRRGVHPADYAAAVEAQINAAMEAGRIAP